MTLHRDNNATSPSQEQIIGTRFSRYVASSYKQSENGAIIDEQGSNSGDVWYSRNVSNGSKGTVKFSTFCTLTN